MQRKKDIDLLKSEQVSGLKSTAHKITESPQKEPPAWKILRLNFTSIEFIHNRASAWLPLLFVEEPQHVNAKKYKYFINEFVLRVI